LSRRLANQAYVQQHIWDSRYKPIQRRRGGSECLGDAPDMIASSNSPMPDIAPTRPLCSELIT
jgi:hypothetical protein